MKIAIVSIDSRGGIQPSLALALGLDRAGHDVRLVVPTNAVAFVAEHGLAAAPLSVDVQRLLRNAGDVAGHRRAGRRSLRGEMAAGMGRWMQEARAAAVGGDLAISGAAGGAVGRSVAESLRVPFLEAHLQPIGKATTAFPGLFQPRPLRRLGGPGRWASHVLTDLVLSAPLLPAVRRARVKALGLPARYPHRDPAVPVLYGFSPRVLPPPASWAGHRHVTGYWTLPLPAGWSPPPDLAAFLEAGPPPICFGFGSMPTDNPAALAEELVTAARRVGRRAVLLSGWGGLDIAAADDLHLTDEVPHEWLFPRAAAVVHHGGAGTTGAGLRAGAPSIVVPHGADQPFWAMRVADLGVGPRPIPRPRLTAPTLAQALDQALTDAPMRARAAALGQQIRSEDGVGAAVAIIDRFLQRSTTESQPPARAWARRGGVRHESATSVRR